MSRTVHTRKLFKDLLIQLISHANHGVFPPRLLRDSSLIGEEIVIGERGRPTTNRGARSRH